MGIYIKGMEMPKDIEPGLVIEFADGIDGKRYARLWHYRHGGLTEWLEAIPVPPHGRLIDADALCMKLKMMYAKAFGEGNTAYHAAYRSLERVVSHEPTIIPAEEGET